MMYGSCYLIRTLFCFTTLLTVPVYGNDRIFYGQTVLTSQRAVL
jgi:hypothetical protein